MPGPKDKAAPKAARDAVAQKASEIQEQAQALDSRRQHQIGNQVEVINRLMAGGADEWGNVERDLIWRLSEAQARVAELEAENADLKAQVADLTAGG